MEHSLLDVLSMLPLHELRANLAGDLGNLRLTNRKGRLLGQLLSTSAFLTVDARESTKTVMDRLAFLGGQEALDSVSIAVVPHAHDIAVHRQALLRAIPFIGRVAGCRPGCLSPVSRMSLTMDEHCLIRRSFLINMDRRRRRLPTFAVDIDLSSTIASICCSFPALQHLAMRRVILNGTPFLPLGSVLTLTSLHVSGLLNASALASIAALTRLRSLRIHFATDAVYPPLVHGVDVRSWASLRQLNDCWVEGARIDNGLSSILSLPHLNRLVASHACMTPLCIADSAMLRSLRTLCHLDLRAGCHGCEAWDAILSLSHLTHLRTNAELPAGYSPQTPQMPQLPHLQHLALCSVPHQPLRPTQLLPLVRMLLPMRTLSHLCLKDLEIWADDGGHDGTTGIASTESVALHTLAGHLACAPLLRPVHEVRLGFWRHNQPHTPMSFEQLRHGLQPLMGAERVLRILLNGVPAFPLVHDCGWTSLVRGLDLMYTDCADLAPADEHRIACLCDLVARLPALERIRISRVLLTRSDCVRLAHASSRPMVMSPHGAAAFNCVLRDPHASEV